MEIYLILFIVSLFFGGWFAFYRYTLSYKRITVAHKYTINGNNARDIKSLITDQDNNTYICNESFWTRYKGQMWDDLEENKQYNIVYYGLNKPSINFYYSVIDMTPANN